MLQTEGIGELLNYNDISKKAVFEMIERIIKNPKLVKYLFLL